jgi:pimeloyl-ACP methyl ester carboxylesterase
MDSAGQAQPVHYRSVAVGGIDVFYRESGLDSAPVVLLLHGFPSSSRMFRDLIPGPCPGGREDGSGGMTVAEHR